MATFSSVEPQNPNVVACKDCHEPISRKAEVCPHCGRRYHLSRTDVVATILIVLFVISAMLALFGMALPGTHSRY